MTVPVVGVLTGDIVDSQKITPEHYEEMLDILKNTLSKLSGRLGARYDIYRGDSFQIIFDDPTDVIESALIIRLALKASEQEFDARQSIGIGTVMPVGDVRTSTGEAFILSGTKLDQLKNYHLSVSSKNAKFQDRIELLTKFLDAHISGLTMTQSAVLLAYLEQRDKSHKDIADSLGKTRSNLTKSLNTSRYQLIIEYIEYFEKSLREEYNL